MLGLAIEEVFGAELSWYSEFDPAASKVMNRHFPHAPNLGDMTKIDWSQCDPVDILSGGTPCQDLSNAGRRKGMTEGTRSNLWVQMREAIATLKPKYVVWENVRGAYSTQADSELEYCSGCMGSHDGGVGLFCEHLDVYSATFPTSGTTRNGVAYELPTWERRMADSASLSLHQDRMFPTPNTMDSLPPREGEAMERQLRRGEGENASRRKSMGNLREDILQTVNPDVFKEQPLLRTPVADEMGGGPLSPAMAKARNQTLRLTGQIVDLTNPGLLPSPDATEGKLFPTPKAGDGEFASPSTSGRPVEKSTHLGTQVLLHAGALEHRKLMPTPLASAGEKGGPNQRDSSGNPTLPGLVGSLLPTPVANASGNTPESHLSKKPGRSKVTDLSILVENGLIETGGRLLPTPVAQDAKNSSNPPSAHARNTPPLAAITSYFPHLSQPKESKPPTGKTPNKKPKPGKSGLPTSPKRSGSKAND